MSKFHQLFQGKKVLITGGLGFIGSNLAIRLVSLGARVSIVDAELPQTGANRFNVAGILNDIDLRISDLKDSNVISEMIQDRDYLFNLAGQASHLDSMNAPKNDLEINTANQLSIIKACQMYNPLVKIVYAGTRQVYGTPKYLPVDEEHPINPIDYNGVSKYAGEMYHLIANQVYGLKTTSLRLTNTYGPRMRCLDGRLTFLGDWVRRLLSDEPIEVYGDGKQIRDLNYVDDVVDALLLAAVDEKSTGQIYNLGSPEPVSLLELAKIMIDIVGSGSYQLVSYPKERAKIELGDYWGDFKKISNSLGWQPMVFLHEGLTRTIEYFRDNKEQYW